MAAEPARLPTAGRRAATTPTAPRHLSREASAFWRSVVDVFDLEPHHLRILQTVCEAMGRMDEARAAVERDGPYIEGRFGMKAHPGLVVEDRSRTAMLRAIRELGLDLEAPATSRPPSRYHR